jgi:hypothetical protein
MATNLGDAFVNISAKDTELTKSLANAQGKVNKSADAMAKKLAGIGKGMAIAGAAITAALGMIIKKTAEAGDKFDKMSLRTGISVEALSSLAYAADISGTSIETMEKGLKGLTMSMNDMSMGMGEAKDAYEKLGVAVVDTDGNLRPTIEVFKEIATKISEIENPTLQASLAMDIFGGRAGPQLLPLLKQGEKGIDELMNKAKELGITMTTEAATAAAEFTDKMTDLRGSLAGAGRMIGDTLIPVLTPLIEKVVEIVGKVKKWAEGNKPLVEAIVKWGGAIGVLMLGLGPLLMMLPHLVTGIGLVKTAILKLNPTVLLITANVIIWYNVIKEIDKILKSHHTTIEDVEKAESTLSEAQIKLAEKLGITIEELKEFQEAGASVSEMLGIELIPAIEETTEAGKKLIPVFDDLEGALKIVNDVAKGLGITLDEFKKKQEAVANATKSLTDKIFELTHTAMEVAIKKLDEERQAYIDLGMSIKEIDKWYDLEIKKLEKLYKTEDKVIDKTKELSKETKKLGKETKETANESKKLADTYSNVSKELDKVTKKTTEYISPLMTISETIATLGGYRRAFEEGGGGFIGSPSSAFYQYGTPYVPRTGLAVVHKGEAIIPASQNTYDQRKNYSSINIQPGAIIINTPKFSDRDAAEILTKIKRRAAMQGYKFATA